jgi:hypothetical protein
MTYPTISTEAVSVHLSLKRRLQQLGSEAEEGCDRTLAVAGSQKAIAVVGVGNAIAHKVFLTLRDCCANFDAPLVADGWLLESYHRSLGHQLL